jgi:pimeloyl-ACP methyl ester carboxylesterase
MGVTPAAAPDGAGVWITALPVSTTGAALGLKPDDVVTSVNGTRVVQPIDFVHATRKLRAGDPLRMEVKRGDRTLTLQGPAVGAPRETYGQAFVEYGAVPFRGGVLRDIYAAPTRAHTGPVLFLIQGYTCGSIDNTDPNGAYRRLTEHLLQRGIAVYRVEKPGVGDSTGGADCWTSDFETEVAAFEEAYKALLGQRGVSRDRLFIFGHSMGGLQAPLVASRLGSPRGVAVYGTVLRPWREWAYDAVTQQSVLLSGRDPVAAAESLAALRPGLDALYGREMTPEDILKDPKLAPGARSIGYSGGEYMSNRKVDYWRGVNAAPLFAAWRDTDSHVLAMYGAADFVAIHDHDHRRLADVTNYYRPGTGRFVSVPETGHGFQLLGEPERLKEAAWSGAPPPAGPNRFNPQVARELADWIDAVMAAPKADTQKRKRAG